MINQTRLRPSVYTRALVNGPALAMKDGVQSTRAATLLLLRRKESKRLLRVGMILLIAAFVGLSLYRSWGAIKAYPWHINWLLLGAGFLCLTAQVLSYGLIWRLILQRMGFALPWRSSMRLWLTAEFVRYIPGNVWHVLARIQWTERAGIAKAMTLASMIIELATRIASGALLFAATLFWWPTLSHLAQTTRYASITLIALGIPLLVLGLHPGVLRWTLNKGLRLMKRDPITLNLRYTALLGITGAWLASWLIGGIGFWLAVWAVVPLPFSPITALLCTGIYALGWDIGFLSFVTPSGLFFREGAIAVLLVGAGLISSFEVGLVIALLAARILPTIAELISVAWAYTIPLPGTIVGGQEKQDVAIVPANHH